MEFENYLCLQLLYKGYDMEFCCLVEYSGRVNLFLLGVKSLMNNKLMFIPSEQIHFWPAVKSTCQSNGAPFLGLELDWWPKVLVFPYYRISLFHSRNWGRKMAQYRHLLDQIEKVFIHTQDNTIISP